MGSLGPIKNTSEDPNQKVKNIPSCSNVDYLFGVKDIRNFISDDTFVVSDRNGDSYSIYFDIENQIFEIDNDHSFLSELESSFYSYRNSSYLNNGFRGEDPYYNSYMYDTQYSWNNHINSCIDNYLLSQICIDMSIISGSENYSDSYIYRVVCDGESKNSSENEGSSIQTHTKGSDLTIRESSNGSDLTIGSALTIGRDLTIGSDLTNGSDLTIRENSNDLESYRPNKKNILVVGPVPGKKYSEMTFPILSPNPATTKDVHFSKYPIYVGGNRGRGQIYPDGSKSNNTVYNATAAGIVSKIIRKEKGGYEITITDASEGRQVVDIIPTEKELLVSEGESIKFDLPLMSNPNVGGFGQGDAEIVLQDPLRVQGLLLFLASVILAQIVLVLKRKQFEKVQLAKINF
ncbi:Cytochrome f [Capsicum baccatum]|uniref:Cytochrome f n=1 Tax=Capsicum baccatum TaxID=33114 RepID=A0A2G2W5B3_CAPBA|nr:Cytochrome f [Capsicum baccatum]